ncbi:MAG: MarR family winged helix-turn-helix transcriptional regulator [Steroidobacteraceae bacterium]
MLIDPLKELPGYALRRASAAFMAKLASRLAPLDLRPVEASVLLIIASNPGVTQSEIGRLLDIASANMAPLAARLADRELIVREPVDGRSHGLTVSEPARRLVKKARRIVEELEAELLERIPVHQRSAFLDALRALSSSRSDGSG